MHTSGIDTFEGCAGNSTRNLVRLERLQQAATEIGQKGAASRFESVSCDSALGKFKVRVNARNQFAGREGLTM
jgi:hypothetical protein